MLVKVVPIRRLPKALSELDYLVPEDLQEKVRIGQLVRIPFRNSEIHGIITKIDISPDQKRKIKKIISLVWQEPSLSEKQLNFLREISEFYNTPLGFVFQSSMLPLKKTKLKKVNIIPQKSQPHSPKIKPTLSIYNSTQEKKDIIQKHIDREGQTLIIMPEVSSATEMLDILKDYKDIAIIHAEIGEKELFENWVKVRNNETKIVISTRRGIFLPWYNLKSIILDSEGSFYHKNPEMAPRIHNREAALMLAHAHSAALFLTDHTPSVDSWYFAKMGIYNTEGKIKSFEQPATFLVDMRAERRAKNYGAISDPLEQALEKPSQDLFLFYNRKGSASYVGCRDCGYVIRCENCGRTMTYHENSGQLECHFCKTAERLSLACPNCRGSNVVMYGSGTELLENELKKKIQNKEIYRIDSTTADFYVDNDNEKIIIGTQIAWDKIKWDKITLMAFVEADLSLYVPEYKVSENLWWQIREAQFKLSKNAEIYIQTGHMEHQVFSNLMQPEKFYEIEASERQSFSYPPFSYLLKIYIGEKTEEEALQKTSLLEKTLKNLTKNQKNINISGPLPFSPVRFQGFYYYAVIIKIGFEKYKQTTKMIAKEVNEEWKFDPNPNNLLSF